MRSFCILLLLSLSCTLIVTTAAKSLHPGLSACLDEVLAFGTKVKPEMEECARVRDQGSDELLTDKEIEAHEKCVDDVLSKYPELNDIKTRCNAAGEDATESEEDRALEDFKSRATALFGEQLE